MDKESLIGKIKSRYILKGVFDYLKDNYTELKLFSYSNLYQKKLGLKLVDYKAKHLERIGFIISRYLHIEESNYKKDNMIQNYNKFLSRKKLNKEEFEKII